MSSLRSFSLGLDNNTDISSYSLSPLALPSFFSLAKQTQHDVALPDSVMPHPQVLFAVGLSN